MDYSKYGFTKTLNVEKRITIADEFRPNRRCGIYLLTFGNKEVYIGQAVDVVRRFCQHKKIHADIISVAFQHVQRKELNTREAYLIGEMEHDDYKLRNISLTSMPCCESDLDLIINKEDQISWINGKDIIDNTQRIDDENQRRKYNHKFNKLIADEIFTNQVIPFLKRYIKKAIIYPNKTELSYWALSCLPEDKNYYKIYSRMNIYKQEVLTIGKEKNVLFFSFHLTDSTFSQLDKKEIEDRFARKYKTLYSQDHYYKSGGRDQINIIIEDYNESMKILEDEIFVNAIRTMNYRLMKKGATYFNRYHCLQIVDLINQAA